LPCGSIERFTGNAVMRFGPVRDATVDQNPFFLAIAMDDPNIKLNIASMAITQAWSLASMPVSNGYNVNGTIIPQTADGGYNRILGITADAGSRALAKRDFCGANEVYASFANGGASINGPITTTTANVGLSLHAFAGHENPNLQSQFYMQFTGNWDATSAALDTSNPGKPNWPVAGSAASQSGFPTVTITDTVSSFLLVTSLTSTERCRLRSCRCRFRYLYWCCICICISICSCRRQVQDYWNWSHCRYSLCSPLRYCSRVPCR
jgi:hypothetical protein